jgi:hypothetical protein
MIGWGRRTRASHARRREHSPCPGASALPTVVPTRTCRSRTGSGPPAIVHAPIHRDAGRYTLSPPCPIVVQPTPSIGSAPRNSARQADAPGDGSAVPRKRTSASLRTVARQLVQEEHSQVGRGSSRGVERPAPTHESRRRDRVVGTVGERTGRPTGGPRPLVPSGGPGCAASSPGPWSPSGLGSAGSQSGSSGAAPALVANYDLEATPQRFAPCGSRSDRGSLAV